MKANLAENKELLRLGADKLFVSGDQAAYGLIKPIDSANSTNSGRHQFYTAVLSYCFNIN